MAVKLINNLQSTSSWVFAWLIQLAFSTLAAPLTASDREQACSLYRNTYVAYHSQIYYVSADCYLEDVTPTEVFRAQRRGVQVREVPDPKVLDVLPLRRITPPTRTARDSLCRTYRGKYFTLEFMFFFYLSPQCELLEFPDWDTYSEHRGGLAGRSEVAMISRSDLATLGPSVLVNSVFDAEWRRLARERESDPTVKLAPEAICRPLLGKYLSYFDHVFLIEPDPNRAHSCRRRPVDVSGLNTPIPRIFRELTSSEAYSIPVADSRP